MGASGFPVFLGREAKIHSSLFLCPINVMQPLMLVPRTDPACCTHSNNPYINTQEPHKDPTLSFLRSKKVTGEHIGHISRNSCHTINGKISTCHNCILVTLYQHFFSCFEYAGLKYEVAH